MYELNRNIEFAKTKFQLEKRVIIATIVNTTGSSYRKKWTQMVVSDDMKYAGHLSGGCVEKEVLRQAAIVFNSNENLIFEYDGTYRLGCKGVIYVLLELVDKRSFEKLYRKLKHQHQSRIAFQQGIDDLENNLKQTYFDFNDEQGKFYLNETKTNVLSSETKTILPHKQLIIIGSEFDSDQLSYLAHQLGYQVTQIVGLSYHIPSECAHNVICVEPEQIKQHFIFDNRTAILLMTHSYARDLHFIKELLSENVAYIGTLGPRKDHWV